MSITIDKEFENLIPPLSAEEFQQLEENCLRDGIRDALIVWEQDGNDILIDGHNRFRIVGKHPTIQFNIKRMQFADRNEAIRWIILNQFGRRNLSAYDRSILALKLKPVIAEKAKEKEAERKTTYQKSEKSELPTVNTTKELAKVAGVSHDTIHKVEAIQKSGNERIGGEMIKVINDWYITVEANPINYVVRHGDGEKDKNSKMKDRGLAYFSTLRGAVKFIRGQIIAEELSGGLRTLGDAIADIDKANERFELLMAKIEA